MGITLDNDVDDEWVHAGRWLPRETITRKPSSKRVYGFTLYASSSSGRSNLVDIEFEEFHNT